MFPIMECPYRGHIGRMGQTKTLLFFLYSFFRPFVFNLTSQNPDVPGERVVPKTLDQEINV